jgi:hypothetical protein
MKTQLLHVGTRCTMQHTAARYNGMEIHKGEE